MREAFCSLYAVFMLAFVAMCVGFIIALSPNAPFSHIYAYTQLQLYAKSMYEMQIMCLKSFDYRHCQHQEFTPNSQYHIQSHLTPFGDSLLLLDVSAQVHNPITSMQQNVLNRHIILKR
ncbi:hypothetical protein [uncultured Helicobacter sp.]|uniref:hypothetical protein n=1 Tax=uncultured Helicobacter sp. TaxID=175537 RepID=UPI00374E693B